MPSRLGVALILLFWLGTTALVGYREVWPRLFADGPPPIRIDLADEAAQTLPTRWTVYRGDQKIGTLTTRMEYVPADDTFRSVSTYGQLKFEFGVATIELPRLETVVRVGRDGELREQHMSGELRAKAGPLELGKASAEVSGAVEGGRLVGRCVVRLPPGNPTPTVDRPLDPVPVPGGQVLNPMMPVNRLRDVRPGRRWVVREVDPLRDALGVLFREALKQSESKLAATALPAPGSRELIAEVRSAPEWLDRKGGERVECWVIEYRGEEVQARTWVSTADGRVMRQEATGMGEKLRFERED
jgi:hypothetical protein